MTLIQPKKNSILINRILFALFLGVVLSASSMVLLYNQTVSLTHSALQAKDDLQKIQTENAELKENIFALLDPTAVKAFAAGKGMVLDPNLRYLEISKQWVFASHL